jgi:DNA modification methylase
MHGRRFVGLEINPEYLELSSKRIEATQLVER